MTPTRCNPAVSGDGFPWYAMRIQAKLAALASAVLNAKGYETFLPLHISSRKWSDRVKKLEVPLFPGYMFCRFDVSRLSPVLTTPGLINIVGAGKLPLAVADHEISAVRLIVGSGLTTQPWPFLENGSKIYIEGGPLTGVEGIIVNAEKIDRLVVSISLLQRSVAVEIKREWVRAVDEDMRPACMLPIQSHAQLRYTPQSAKSRVQGSTASPMNAGSGE